MRDSVPSYQSLVVPVVLALQQLGGTRSVEEIKALVIQHFNLSDKAVSEKCSSKTTKTKLVYNIGWARSNLIKKGVAVPSSRGTSTLDDRFKNASLAEIKAALK